MANPNPGRERDKIFMATACLASKFSEDPVTKVGACVVTQENEILGSGYNRMPKGTEGLPWDKDRENQLDNKYLYVCHAVLNAIMNVKKTDLSGCTVYTTLFPGNESAKIIIQAGIKKVIYLSDKYHDREDTVASRRMLGLASVDCSQNDGNPDFMAVAQSAAEESKDPITKVGACIVSQDGKVVGTGYNSMPNGTTGQPWDKDEENPLFNKYTYVCHAVPNAIVNAFRTDLSGCTVYTTLFPGSESTKIIIQAGIKKVVYLSDKYHDREDTIASRRMLDLASVDYSPYPRPRDTVEIQFSSFYGPGEL